MDVGVGVSVCLCVCACEFTTNISITRHYRQYFHSTAEITTNNSVTKANRLAGGVLNLMKDQHFYPTTDTATNIFTQLLILLPINPPQRQGAFRAALQT